MVSAIIPAYNAEKTIVKCVDSLLHQTIDSLEVIVVDDGSNDSTLDAVRQLAQRDARVIVIQKANGGVSSARNCGLEAASGEYIYFLDSDDYVHPDLLQRMLAVIEDTTADVVVCNYFREVHGRAATKGNVTGFFVSPGCGGG